MDLLSNGYAIVAPSDTSREPDGGGQYRWVQGHSPYDIHFTELEPPSDDLVTWWLDRAERTEKAPGRGSHQPVPPSQPEPKDHAWQLVRSPIAEGGRNETLTRIAGWLRLYHPSAVVEALLSAINESRCQPPLPEREVSSIVKSVCKYPQPGVNGHPRAVVPSFSRRS